MSGARRADHPGREVDARARSGCRGEKWMPGGEGGLRIPPWRRPRAKPGAGAGAGAGEPEPSTMAKSLIVRRPDDPPGHPRAPLGVLVAGPAASMLALASDVGHRWMVRCLGEVRLPLVGAPKFRNVQSAVKIGKPRCPGRGFGPRRSRCEEGSASPVRGSPQSEALCRDSQPALPGVWRRAR